MQEEMKQAVLDFHEIAGMFPLIEGDEFNELVADVKAHGVKMPVVLYDGKILDGRNRYRAAQLAGVDFETEEFHGTPLEAIEHAWSLNHARRHLTSSQRAMSFVVRRHLSEEYAVAVKALQDDAKERMDQTKDRERDEKGRLKPPTQLIEQVVENRNDRSTTAMLAKAAKSNRQYIDDAQKVYTEHPEFVEPILKGEKAITQVKREIRDAELRQRAVDLPSDKYRVIYADPPWKYGSDGLDQYGPAARHYPTMTVAELCEMGVKDIAEENAVLFLWTTSPLLFECAPIIAAWGFKYKAHFVWDKVRHNFGNYCSVRHELLLVCTRGSCTPDEKKLFDSVQVIEKTKKHSEKPQEFRGIIETLYPNGKRIELFARANVEGWDAFGNEA